MTNLAEGRPLPAPGPSALRLVWGRLSGNTAVAIGGALFLLVVLVAVLAPMLAPADPTAIAPANRLKPPSANYPFGTDAFGRDLLSRALHGARISLAVGIGAAVTSVAAGLLIGLAAGYFRLVDALVMRVMDGLMAIPNILLAIALVALSGATLTTVLVAITIPEIPRVVRLVRSIVLGVREEPYVEAAIASGTRLPLILWRHVAPNTVAPLIVQGTYVCASAILTEAILSFLGAGISPETPTWGNIIAEGRIYFQLAPTIILFPGLLLSVTVLSINMLGDGLRDTLDPKLVRRTG
ncbi:ABC transporter permease [Arenibaculum sp.]|jgi:peptide/nickel transport system permease protein|uniref:ABC transporter permease n=1 Tax=Arenibaculum sp. TaxID=2865862 RepID=UPI002E112718|nr:ABC transporter permease [Arenibaculum sp.]